MNRPPSPRLAPPAGRRAFTLIELLVAIGVVAILVTLLLPAVQQAREAARRSQCKNNLKQIGLALHNYESTFGVFPPFFVSGGGNPTRIADERKGANWLTLLLPQMEQQGLYDAWDMNAAPHQNEGRSRRLPALLCPSDPQTEGEPCAYAGGGWARGSYGMNVSPCRFGVGQTLSPSDPKFDYFNGAPGGFGAVNSRVALRDFTDGASNTIAVDEIRVGVNAQDLRGSWAMPGLGSGVAGFFGDANQPNSPAPFADDMENCAATGQLGSTASGMGCFNTGTGPDSSTGQMTARSAHPGGVQVVLADGAVRFIAETIEYGRGSLFACDRDEVGLWQALHTREGGELLGEF